MEDQDEQAEDVRGKARREDGGARAGHRNRGDHRVTRFIDWLLAAIGGAILLLVWRAGDTLIDLKVTVATLAARADGKDQRDNAQDHRLDTLEEKTFRGVDGYANREPKRGR